MICSGKKITIGTLFFEEAEHGWSWDELSVNATTITRAEIESMPDVAPDKAANESTRIPQKLLNAPGLVGEIAKYSESTQHRRQPVFAVAAALSTVATVQQNHFRVKARDTPLGLYLIIVGPTTAGKESPRQTASEIMKQLMLSEHVFETVASGPALLAGLAKLAQEDNPTVLLLLDELGRLLQRSSGGDLHMLGFATDIMSLFGRGNGMFNGKQYADAKRNIEPFHGPFVNVLGTTTPSTLTDAMSSREILDGFLNRFMMVSATEEAPELELVNIKRDIPQGVMKKLTAIRAAAGLGASPTVYIEYGPDVLDILRTFSREADGHMRSEEPTGPLWARAVQNAIAVAGVLAIGDADDLDNPVITADHVQWAVVWVRWCCQEAAALIGDHVADNDQERDRKKVMNLIHNCADQKYIKSSTGRNYTDHLKKGWAPKSWVLRKSKMSARDMNEAMITLIESGLVEVAEEATGGRVKTKLYRAVK